MSAFHRTSKNALLNQTDIGNNNNKFYVIQILKSDTANQWTVFNRWGRVGANGQTQVLSFNNLDAAISSFEQKFYDKTGNHWSERDKFVKKTKKYFLLERDHGADEEESSATSSVPTTLPKNAKTPDSKLPLSVQKIIGLIFNTEIMEKEMKEIGYDASKMPLGKLTKRTMQQGYEVLKQIADEIAKPIKNREMLTELSSQFYTIIPHVFGMSRPPILDSAQIVKQKLQMLEALTEMQVTSSLLSSSKINLDINPIDSKYDSLKCKMVPIEKDSETYKLIETYTSRTHGHTHTAYKLSVEDVFELERDDTFDSLGKKMHNRRLLWHGSRLTNFVGILSQGLRIAPPEAPVTGYMFGKGVYFADMVTKSANYCCTNRSDNTGLMLLCDVALGDENALNNADFYAAEKMKSAGKNSTWGMGRTIPDPKEYVTMPDGVVVPCGKSITSDKAGLALQYNEFITYDLSQIRMRYLVRMKFNYR
ncbi:poly polymerase catalytic domain-containing protein [Zopfochytrium polystomum]|nr:poly polymerase catalytic domain-containing protein [Zopfochytrium polystomum]